MRRKEKAEVDGYASIYPQADAPPEYYEAQSRRMEHDYHRYVSKKILFILLCIAGMVVTMGVAVMFGSSGISVMDVYKDIWYHFFNTEKLDTITDWVVFTMRLPRILTGLVTGASLAICGAAMQSMLKNPLADPYTTGISSGASFGFSISIVLGFTVGGIGGTMGTILTAFVFALIPAAVIIVVSSLKKTSASMMILSGIAVMYLFNACTTLIQLTASDATLSALFRYTTGDLSDSTWTSFYTIALFTLVGGAIIWACSKKLNILITGDNVATALGLNAHRLRIVLLIIISLMAASVVCFCGIIGFVGIVAPHLVRLFLGSDNRYLIPAAAAFGALFMMITDLISRVIIAPTFLPVGVICAFIGAPIFLWLLIKQRKSTW